MKKKIKKQSSQTCAEAVGNEVEPVTSACGHKMFLYQFCQAAIGDADENGEPNGSFLVG